MVVAAVVVAVIVMPVGVVVVVIMPVGVVVVVVVPMGVAVGATGAMPGPAARLTRKAEHSAPGP